MNYTEAREYINSYTKSGGKVKNLSRAEGLMKKLGDPQKNLKFVHIAGTNGKGSVLELMSQSLINAGYRTGQFTSPFMRVYEDRIRINGENISEDKVAEYCTAVAEAAGDEQYSQFEITMAVAMLHFAAEKCDIVFLEAGIGGVFDCTNIIEEPVLSVITSISLDHTDILGKTVQEIAMQKAGIIKRDRPVVISWDNRSVLQIFQKECIFKNSLLIIPTEDEFENIETDEDGGHFEYNGVRYNLKMHGRHQIINAAAALKALEVLEAEGFEAGEKDIQKAFSEVQVLSRVEVISKNPDIIIDGGHNPAGISALLSALTSMNIVRPVFIFGMVSSKDAETAAMLLSSYAKAVVCVDGFAPNATDRTKLASMIKCDKYAAAAEDALTLAKMVAKSENSPIVICGSLYMTEIFRKML
ncbi:MAG: bifunctional folylpolyglutamate synthase/dihydrofolate synthase [Oscillospiraceae bacterium]|nr:bifunctional folylpolyglutamate synthase/dihydrofolate synthase [Oscillospiraceae bacterium]